MAIAIRAIYEYGGLTISFGCIPTILPPGKFCKLPVDTGAVVA